MFFCVHQQFGNSIPASMCTAATIQQIITQMTAITIQPPCVCCARVCVQTYGCLRFCSPGVCPSDSRESAWSGVSCKTGPGVLCGICVDVNTNTTARTCTCRYHKPPMVIVVPCAVLCMIVLLANVRVRWLFSFGLRSETETLPSHVIGISWVVQKDRQSSVRNEAQHIKNGNRFHESAHMLTSLYGHRKYVFITILEPIAAWGWATFQTL